MSFSRINAQLFINAAEKISSLENSQHACSVLSSLNMITPNESIWQVDMDSTTIQYIEYKQCPTFLIDLYIHIESKDTGIICDSNKLFLLQNGEFTNYDM